MRIGAIHSIPDLFSYCYCSDASSSFNRERDHYSSGGKTEATPLFPVISKEEALSKYHSKNFHRIMAMKALEAAFEQE